jgi:hypothetical protein
VPFFKLAKPSIRANQKEITPAIAPLWETKPLPNLTGVSLPTTLFSRQQF